MFIEITPTNELFYKKIDRRLRLFQVLTIPSFASVDFFKKEDISYSDEEQLFPLTSTYSSSVYGAGLFVSVSDISNNVLVYNISEGTFEEVTVSKDRSGDVLAFGSNLFVSIVDNNVITSEDGKVWSDTAILDSGWKPGSLIYSGDKFVALPNGGTTGYYSTNGSEWTSFALPIDQVWKALSFGNDIYVALAYGTTIAMNSVDGIEWKVVENFDVPFIGDWCSIVYGNETFLAVGSTDRTAIASKDGIFWRKVDVAPSFEEFNCDLLTYSGEFFVLVDSIRGKARMSADGAYFTDLFLNCTGGTSVSSSSNVFVMTLPSGASVFKFSSIPSENKIINVMKGSRVYYKAYADEYAPKVGTQVVTQNYSAVLVMSYENQLTFHCGTFITSAIGTRPFIFKTVRAKIPVSRIAGTFEVSSGDMDTIGINSLRKDV